MPHLLCLISDIHSLIPSWNDVKSISKSLPSGSHISDKSSRLPANLKHSHNLINDGKRTEWSPIRSVIIKVINIINHNYNKICDFLGLFLIKTQEFWNSESFFVSSEKCDFGAHVLWRVLSYYLGMTCTVIIHCPISAEIRIVDSQSDLRLLLK